MRAILQRVKGASVTVDGEVISQIGQGLAILLGVGKGDTAAIAAKMADKAARLRIFGDEDGKMNLSVLDIGGQALVVSQFTLYADTKRGRRPGFDSAAPPDIANELYEQFVEEMKALGVPVATGRFQSHMLFNIQNDGPVTITLDSSEF